MKTSEIEQLLPGVFQRALTARGPLKALLEVMEQMHEPVEQMLENLDTLLDPRRTEDRLVPMLARWLDLERVLRPAFRGREPSLRQVMPSGLGHLRELVADAEFLSRRRGTAVGLKLFLETASGVTGFEVDQSVPGEDGMPRPFHVRISAPAAAKPLEDMLQRIVESEKPAHVTHELRFV